MKRIGIIGMTALFLLVGMSAPANARQEKQDEKAKPAKQEQQAKPENKHQQSNAPQHQQANAPKQEQQAKPSKQGQPQQPRSQQNQQQQQRQQQQTASSQRPQRSQQDQDRQRAYPALRLSARGSGRIPDDRFRSNFGREHSFRIGEPVMVGGYSRFRYGGYWFGFAEPWPVGWYYTDDVYIDYVDGGYYMYDPYYPGARFAISVVI